MKRSLSVLSILVLIAVSGCSILGGRTQEQVIPTSEPVVEPPPPVVEPAQPTEEVAYVYEPEMFYTEEFEEGSPTEEFYGGWTNSYDDIETYLDGGKIWWNIEKDNWWHAISYDAYEYNNVKMTVNVESRGSNANAVVLMCHMQAWDEGRYEFIIGSNGLYQIRDVHFENGVQAWDKIADGGSGKIKPGNAINEYSIVCDGQDLALYVNGTKVWSGTVSTSLPQLYDGYIAFGATSEIGHPVTLGFDWLMIEEP